MPQQTEDQNSGNNSHAVNREVQEVIQSDSSLSTSTEESPDLFIEPILVEGLKKSTAWFADVLTGSGNLTFKLDTGAEASILPQQVYDKLEPKPQLKL